MLSLYIHIPFCEKKCFYCSFPVSIGQRQRIDQYLKCLSEEAGRYGNRTLKTVYLGGGTPTFLEEDQLVKLFDIVRGLGDRTNFLEWTIEANPEGLNLSKLKLLKALGAGRISLGIQTFNNKFLKFLGRIHNDHQAINSYEMVRKAGFDNVNVDLMFGFPGQTNADLAQDIDQILNLQSEHVSVYELTVEENSRFYVRNVTVPHNNARKDQYLNVVHRLNDAGVEQYEISNFSRSGKQSLHNLNYWKGGNYIGLGMGAHSHLDGLRYWNTPKLMLYIEKIEQGLSAVVEQERLSVDQRLKETVLIGLRMNEGIDINQVEKSLDCKLNDEARSKIDEFIKEGLLTAGEGRIKTTFLGRLVLDEMSARLI